MHQSPNRSPRRLPAHLLQMPEETPTTTCKQAPTQALPSSEVSGSYLVLTPATKTPHVPAWHCLCRSALQCHPVTWTWSERAIPCCTHTYVHMPGMHTCTCMLPPPSTTTSLPKPLAGPQSSSSENPSLLCSSHSVLHPGVQHPCPACPACSLLEGKEARHLLLACRELLPSFPHPKP